MIYLNFSILLIIVAVLSMVKDIFSFISKKNIMYNAIKFTVLDDAYYNIQFKINIIADILVIGLCLIDIFIYKMDSLLYALTSLVVLWSIYSLEWISVGRKLIKKK